MELVLEIYKNLFPVLAFIGIGYFLKKTFNFSSGIITKPLIYLFLPVLVIYKIYEAETTKIIVIPVIAFLLAFSMNLPALLAKKTFAKDENINLLKSSYSFFNVAFFGIPVVTALFGTGEISTLICIYLGCALYGNTVGYYQVAKTKMDSSKAVAEFLKIPFLYVFIFAFIVKFICIDVPSEVDPYMDILSWVVSAAGMMVIGLGLKEVSFKKTDSFHFLKIIGLRHLAAVFALAFFVAGEYFFLEILEVQDYKMLALLPFFPIASNVALFASFLDTEEKKFSLLVLFSMVISLILVPIAAQFLSL